MQELCVMYKVGLHNKRIFQECLLPDLMRLDMHYQPGTIRNISRLQPMDSLHFHGFFFMMRVELIL